MDAKSAELLEKCKESAGSGDVMGACKVMLQMMENEKIKVEEDTDQTYLEMAENLKPDDVRKVLKMALEIRESGDIKDPELKNAASILIRAIEMS
jgi:predicted transcriptional regulator